MPRFPNSYAHAVARWRVLFGFALVAAFAWFSVPDARSLAWGLPAAGVGLALRAWAAGHLAKNQRLATGGPYGYVRNPLYLGTALAGAGLAIASRQALLGALFVEFMVTINQMMRPTEMARCHLSSGRNGAFPKNRYPLPVVITR